MSELVLERPMTVTAKQHMGQTSYHTGLAAEETAARHYHCTGTRYCSKDTLAVQVKLIWLCATRMSWVNKAKHMPKQRSASRAVKWTISVEQRVNIWAPSRWVC